MTTSQLPSAATLHPTDPAAPSAAARVSFRQPISTEGFVDAAWWPHGTDLTVELPPLLDLLWTAGRDINRIAYNLHAWDAAPRTMRLQGRVVRLGGFATGDPLMVGLVDAWGREHIDILVIAPECDPAVAERALQLAATTGGTLRAAEIMAQATSRTPAAVQG